MVAANNLLVQANILLFQAKNLLSQLVEGNNKLDSANNDFIGRVSKGSYTISLREDVNESKAMLYPKESINKMQKKTQIKY